MKLRVAGRVQCIGAGARNRPAPGSLRRRPPSSPRTRAARPDVRRASDRAQACGRHRHRPAPPAPCRRPACAPRTPRTPSLGPDRRAAEPRIARIADRPEIGVRPTAPARSPQADPPIASDSNERGGQIRSESCEITPRFRNASSRDRMKPWNPPVPSSHVWCGCASAVRRTGFATRRFCTGVSAEDLAERLEAIPRPLPSALWLWAAAGLFSEAVRGATRPRGADRPRPRGRL